MKVLFSASEVVPFAKTGGLADVCGALPLALEKKGVEVVITLPCYKSIDLGDRLTEKVAPDIIETSMGRGIRVFLLQNDRLFGREGIYGSYQGDYGDNFDRFQYYCQRTLELLKEINFKVDIAHCHDWQSALIPVFLKTKFRSDPFYQKMKSVLTIHNIAYQGLFSRDQFYKLGLGQDVWASGGLIFDRQIGLLKAGIVNSDKVTTVSPQYAKEIQGRDFGCGLDSVLRLRQEPPLGILNGVDYDVWDPAHDHFIEETYSAENLEGKAAVKQKLQEAARLTVRKDVPLFAFIGRLASQKGLDLLMTTMGELSRMDLQIVFLGVGEERYQNFLKECTWKYPGKVAAFVEFNEARAHQIYAGADFLLMPSAYEPCGLNQMISLKYGTLPIVSPRGGLIDTIKSWDSPDGQGNGFVMRHYSSQAFIETMQKAFEIYHSKDIFHGLIQKALSFDFSWEKSANEYKNLYEQCLS